MKRISRKRRDHGLKAIVYIASSFSILVLVSIFIFVFVEGLSYLHLDLLTKPYWSENYLIDEQKVIIDNNFEQVKQTGVYTSKKLGISVSDSTNMNNEPIIIIDHILDGSPFATFQYENKKKHLEVGMQIDALQYINSEGEALYAGSVVSNDAKEFVETIDNEATEVQSIYLKTQGGGIRGSLLATLYLILISLLIAIPIGIGASIYLEEYAKAGRWKMLLSSGIEILTGIPSIIYGFMGITVLFPITAMVGANGSSILLGGMTMACILLPVIIKATQETLRMIPRHLRDASLSLGATNSQTIFKVVLPNAITGILSGVILAIGRVVGESAALIFAMGTFINDSPSILNQGTSLAVHIWTIMSGEHPNFALASAIAFVILCFTLILQLIVKLLSKRIQTKY